MKAISGTCQTDGHSWNILYCLSLIFKGQRSIHVLLLSLVNVSEYPVECACGQVKTACRIAMGTTQSQSGSGHGRGVAKPADAEEQR